MCPLGQYSLISNPESDTKCLFFKEGMLSDDTYGDHISIKKGFWRASNDTDDVINCPRKDTCLGGNSIDSELCAAGHVGVTCSSCDTNGTVRGEG